MNEWISEQYLSVIHISFPSIDNVSTYKCSVLSTSNVKVAVKKHVETCLSDRCSSDFRLQSSVTIISIQAPDSTAFPYRYVSI